jgi:hexosaminidase
MAPTTAAVLLAGLLSAAAADAVMVWPAPQSMSASGRQLTLEPGFRILAGDDQECDPEDPSDPTTLSGCILLDAIERYTAIAFRGGNVTGNASKPGLLPADRLAEVKVMLSDDSAALGLDTCENYTIEIKGGDPEAEPWEPRSKATAVISSCTVYGGMHGLETFVQLLSSSGQSWSVPEVSIADGPRFHFRGLLIDSSRHYLPMPVLKATVDALSYNKMNVLHWHIVDGDSFPFESKVFPSLTSHGAYSKSHIYTHAQIAELVKYAQYRGVRVMPEFDTPGHTFPSWCNGAAADGSYPQVCTACSPQHKGDSGWGPLRADLNSTYAFLESLFTEIASVFPEQYLHLGGDEVSFACWLENKDVRDFMLRHKFTGADLENYYEGRLLDIVGGPKVKKSYMVWQEIFNNGVKAKMDTVIDVWKGFDKNTMAQATKAGYRVCLSGGWYLDSLKTTPGHFDGWDYYLQEPTDFEGSAAQKALVMGGKAAMWGEHVDATNLLSRIWPRASCVAERLWSPASGVMLFRWMTRKSYCRMDRLILSL